MSLPPSILPTLRVWLLRASLPLLALATLAGWSLATPVGSSPDDDYHLASTWCAQGERSGACGVEEPDGERIVALDLVVASVCAAHDPNASAACQGGPLDSGVGPYGPSARGNFAQHLYPPVYYAAMSVVVSHDVGRSVLVMRMLNALLLVALGAALWWLLPARRRYLAFVPLALTVVPVGLSLVASTNPSAWAIASGAYVWVSVVGYFETRGRRAVGLAVTAAIATIVGAGARADSALYAIVAIAVAMLLSARRTRAFATRSLVPVALVGIAGALYLTGSQGSAISEGLTGQADSVPISLGENVVATLSRIRHFPGLIAGAFGHWPLGWFDTPMPTAVVYLAAIPVGAAVVLGIRRLDRAKFVALGLLAFVTLAAPLIVLAKSRAPIGQYVQPRYILPLLIVFVGVALYRRDAPGLGGPRAVPWVSAGLLAVAHAIALHAVIRRYVTGVDLTGWNLDENREWWWDVPVGPMATWIATSLLFTALMAGFALVVDRSRQPVGSPSAPLA